MSSHSSSSLNKEYAERFFLCPAACFKERDDDTTFSNPDENG